MTLTLEEYSRRYLRPAMRALARKERCKLLHDFYLERAKQLGAKADRAWFGWRRKYLYRRALQESRLAIDALEIGSDWVS